MTGIADVFTPEVNLEPEWTEPRAAAPRRGRVLRRLVRNPAAMFGLVVVVLVVGMAVFAPLLAPYDPNDQTVAPPAGAVSEHGLGTDDFGRDS